MNVIWLSCFHQYFAISGGNYAAAVGLGRCWLTGLLCVGSPFLFPFAVRRQLFFTCSLDRDRALQRLLEAAPAAAGPERRLAPRLERRRRTVSRRQPAAQAETLLAELATSPALLEVQYRDEPGSGLGPTLEFYSQVCADLQVSEH